MNKLSFERVTSLADARCWKCRGPLGEARDSGHAQGHGALRAPCARCKAITWFDLVPASPCTCGLQGGLKIGPIGACLACNPNAQDPS